MADLRQRRASSAVTDPLHTDSPNVTATTDAPRCPLGFSGAPPPGHPPVDAASGARCPFGFSSSAPAAAPAAAPRLLSVAEVPAWMRDNDFIETLYRPQLSSAILCVRSGFLWLTNETVNVWTHFVASLFFAALAALLCARTGMWTPSALPYYVRHLAAAAASAADAQPLDAAALRALSAEWRARGAAAALRVANLAPDALARVARPLLAELRVGTLPLLLTATFCTAASTAFHVFSCYSPRALRIFAQVRRPASPPAQTHADLSRSSTLSVSLCCAAATPYLVFFTDFIVRPVSLTTITLLSASHSSSPLVQFSQTASIRRQVASIALSCFRFWALPTLFLSHMRDFCTIGNMIATRSSRRIWSPRAFATLLERSFTLLDCQSAAGRVSMTASGRAISSFISLLLQAVACMRMAVMCYYSIVSSRAARLALSCSRVCAFCMLALLFP